MMADASATGGPASEATQTPEQLPSTAAEAPAAVEAEWTIPGPVGCRLAVTIRTHPARPKSAVLLLHGAMGRAGALIAPSGHL